MLFPHSADTSSVRPPTHTSRPAPNSQDGFTIVELLIVVVIIAILMAAAFALFGGSKETSQLKAAMTAGATYSQAVERFQVDYAGKLPEGDTWPTTDAMIKGPIDTRVDPPRPYLTGSQVPENVSTKDVPGVIMFSPTGADRSTPGPQLRYVTGDEPGPGGIARPAYRIEIWIKSEKHASGFVCAYGDLATGIPPNKDGGEGKFC